MTSAQAKAQVDIARMRLDAADRRQQQAESEYKQAVAAFDLAIERERAAANEELVPSRLETRCSHCHDIGHNSRGCVIGKAQRMGMARR